MPSKSVQPKILYRVEFWEENREHKPIHVAYVMARTPMGAKNTLKYRGFEQARQQNKIWLSHLFYRDDILVTAVPDEKWAAKQVENKQKQKLVKFHMCQECGSQLDDDYCQECGWRRQSSWLERALAKQGETVGSGEQ